MQRTKHIVAEIASSMQSENPSTAHWRPANGGAETCPRRAGYVVSMSPVMTMIESSRWQKLRVSEFEEGGGCDLIPLGIVGQNVAHGCNHGAVGE